MDYGPIYGTSLREPPSNLLAEYGVLGAIMVVPKSLDAVAGFLEPEHFYDPLHGRIYAEARRRILAGEPADAVTLKTWFEADPDFGGKTPAEYLAKILSAYVGPGTAGPYGQQILETWMRRQLIGVGEEIVQDGFSDHTSPKDIAASAVQRIEAAFGDAKASRTVSFNEAMDEALQAADEASRRDGPSGVSTGMRSVDDRIGGLDRGALVVLGGRPGMGKTALATQWSLTAARAGVGVLIVSLEMSARDLARRTLAAAARISVISMKSGRFTTDEASRLIAARRERDNLPLSIEDAGGLTATMIDFRIREAKRRHGVGLLVVDHLHIIKPEAEDIRNGPTWIVGRTSDAMKRIAKAHDIPVLLLAQLNRAPEGRDDKRPGLSDLRQSGDIEQNADVVGFLYRAEYYLANTPEPNPGEGQGRYEDRVVRHEKRKQEVAGKAELILAKIRDGQTGTVHLRFDGETVSFCEEH